MIFMEVSLCAKRIVRYSCDEHRCGSQLPCCDVKQAGPGNQRSLTKVFAAKYFILEYCLCKLQNGCRIDGGAALLQQNSDQADYP